MAGNPITSTTVNQQIASDATYMQDQIYEWLKERLEVWSVNAGNTTQLNTLGITNTTDQNQILGLQIDMQSLITLFENGTVGVARNIVQDCAFLRGAN